MITLEEYYALRNELNEYSILCNNYNYTPSKKEFDEIIRYILLLSNTAIGTLCESYESNSDSILNNLYESFGFDENISEKGEGQAVVTGEKDLESATGLVIAATNKATEGVGNFIQYLFYKGSVKKAVKKEIDLEMNRMKKFKKLADLISQLSELDPSVSTQINF